MSAKCNSTDKYECSTCGNCLHVQIQKSMSWQLCVSFISIALRCVYGPVKVKEGGSMFFFMCAS